MQRIHNVQGKYQGSLPGEVPGKSVRGSPPKEIIQGTPTSSGKSAWGKPPPHGWHLHCLPGAAETNEKHSFYLDFRNEVRPNLEGKPSQHLRCPPDASGTDEIHRIFTLISETKSGQTSKGSLPNISVVLLALRELMKKH